MSELRSRRSVLVFLTGIVLLPIAIVERSSGAEPDVPPVLATTPQTDTWPSFRGSGANGLAGGQNLPDEWNVDEGREVCWKTPIPGLANSAPVVWRDRVFVTTAVSSVGKPDLRIGLYGAGDAAEDDAEQSWRVYCLSASTGDVLWKRTAFEGLPTVRRHEKSTHANSTPATDGRHVVALINTGGLYCYDVCGRLLWSQQLGVLDSGAFDVPELQWGFGSSPIIFRNLVIVQCDIQKDSFIAAYDLTNGCEAWKVDRDELPSWGTPTVHDGLNGPLLIANGSNFVRGYDACNGNERWKLSGNSFITVPTPFVADGLIFVTSGYRPVQPIHAIRLSATEDITPEDEEERSEHLAWSRSRDGTYIPTPIVVDRYLFTLSTGGVLTCYEAATGKGVYRRRVGTGSARSFSASVVAADGRLYLTSEAGIVYVVSVGPEFKLVAENSVGEYCLATPAISGGRILFRTQSGVVAIGRDKP